MPSKISYSLLHFHTLLVFFSTIHIIEGESANAIVDHKSLTSEIQPEQDPTFLFENPITGLDSQVDQLSDDYEETNFLEIIAEEVAGLHHIGGCGGTLQSPRFGVIKYKEYTNYTDNENCTWRIEIPEAVGILFTLVESGFETCCDFLTMYAVGDNNAVNDSPRELKYTNASVIVSGSRAIVRFSSDRSTAGYGFRLRFQKIPNFGSSVKDSQCGGVLTEEAGTLNYKLGMEYSNNEWCVWLLHSKASMSFTFYLIQEGFESCCDYLLVNTVDPETGLLQNYTKKINAQSPFEVVEASLVIITFYSDASNQGTGFSLQFSSISNDVNPKYNFKMHHTTKINGTVVYPDPELNWDFGSADERDTIYVIASNAVTNEAAEQYYTVIDWKGGTFQRINYSCSYHSLIIYEPELSSNGNVHGTWSEKAHVPNGIETFCPDVITTRETNSLLTLAKPSFIIVFKVLSAHKNGSETSFKFNYQQIPHVCGGLLQPLTNEFGEISYKEGVKYAHNENCTWTIEVPGAELISFHLEKSGLETCCDIVTVMTSRSNSFDADLTPPAILKYENSRASVPGPRAMVKFSSDATNSGTGFRLRYQKLTVSNESDGACGGIVRPVEGEVGVIRYKENENYEDNEYCIWLIEVPMAQSISFNLEKNGFEANFDYLLVTSTDVLAVSRGLSFKLTSATRTASLAGPKAVVRFSSDRSGIGSGFRLLFGSSEHTLLTQEEELCGGTLETSDEEFGWLSYREEENYDNDESCLWRIEIPAATRIGFTLEKNGFETCCDYVSVYSADASGAPTGPSLKLESENSTTVVMGPRAMVKFFSDQSKTGLGFRLYFQKMSGLDTTTEEGKCGGVIVGKTGVLNYKQRKEYLNNEYCVWLLHSPNSTSITLNLLEHGFEERFDYLLVNTIDSKTGTICNNILHLNGTNDIQTIEESLLIIVFQSDFSNRGIGFSLAFSSSGNNSNPDYSFNLLHISEPNGTIEYPYPSSIWKTSGIKNKPLSIIAYSLNQGTEEESFFSVAMRLSWKHGVFRRANQHCEYDTVTIYTAPKISGWNLVSRFPTVNDTSNCPDIVTVMAKELRTSMYPTFLAVFKPVASDEIAKEKDEATSFAFTYENGGCGGVYVEDSGVIRYKDDGKYANDEECIWLIHVPFAESISFELEHGMFEAKADYISVSSVKPFIGVENETIVISSENRKATVKGPLTVVTFTSDRSNYRYGFRLYFRMEKRMTETDDPMVAFKLFHQNRRFQNEFAYHAEPNQIAIIAFSSGIRRAGRNRIDVTYFLPQVNESCSSDSLLVYDVYGRVGRTIVLTKNFTAEVSNVEETHMDGSTVVRRCTALVNRQLQTCINNETCHAPVGGSFRTKSSSFLAIYSIAV